MILIASGELNKHDKLDDDSLEDDFSQYIFISDMSLKILTIYL